MDRGSTNRPRTPDAFASLLLLSSRPNLPLLRGLMLLPINKGLLGKFPNRIHPFRCKKKRKIIGEPMVLRNMRPFFSFDNIIRKLAKIKDNYTKNKV